MDDRLRQRGRPVVMDDFRRPSGLRSHQPTTPPSGRVRQQQVPRSPRQGLRQRFGTLPRWARLAAIFVVVMVLLGSLGGGTYALFFGGESQPATANSVSLTKGLVGWWPMNGNTKDLTPYGNNGTAVSASLAPDRQGLANRAYSFNGTTSSYVSVPRGSAQQPTSQVSLSLWVKISGSGSNAPRAIVLSANSTYIDACFSGKILFSLMLTSGQKLITGGSCPAVGTWHLYTVTYDGVTARVYQDGAEVGTAAYSDPIAQNATDLYIGRYNGGGYALNGSADDVRMYNRALNPAEVAVLYAQHDAALSMAGDRDGLIGHWKFDGNAKDATPYGNNGAVSGTVTAASDRHGNASSAYTFGSGGPNRIAAPIGATSYPGLTLSAWVKPTAYPTERSTIIQGSSPNAYYLSLNTDGSVQTYWYGRNTQGYFSSGAGTVPLNQWSFVTATWDASTVKLYVNGALKYSTANTGVGDIPTSLVFGAESAARQFIGSLDDIRVYNRALGIDQIQTVYTTADMPLTLAGSGRGDGVNLGKGLVGKWALSGDAIDSTPYSNNGTIFGAITTIDRFGKSGQALNFNGTNSDYVAIPSDTVLNPGSNGFSVSIWFKADVAGTLDGSIVYNKEDLFEASAGGGYFTYAWQPHWAWDGGTSFPISVGTWYHATVVYDGTTQYLYKNGQLVYSRAQTGAMGSNTNRLGLATRGVSLGGQSPFTGSLSDMRIYNRALSAEEVAALYTAQ